MALKKISKPRHGPSLLILASVFCAVLFVFSSPMVRGEAASDLLGRYTCSQAKKLIETDPVKIFDMWLKSDGYFSTTEYSQAVRDEVALWGTYNRVVKNTDLINKMIEGLDEAVNGTAENTVKIFAKFFIKKTMEKIAKSAAGGGLLGAVITVGEELHQFASDLNAEILDINVRNIAAAVVGEHPATGKNVDNNNRPLSRQPELLDEKYFLESYLGWDGEKFIRYDGYTNIREMNARRSMLVDYAGLKLGWDVIGKENTLGGWKLNEIRTVIHILLKEVNEQVEKKRKLKQMQGVLKKELNGLKRQQQVLSTFQSLSQQVLAMTCQKTSQPCLDAQSNVLSKISDYIVAADGSYGVLPDVLLGFKDSVNNFYGSLERIDTIMQTEYQPGVEGYCRAVTATASLLAEGIAQAGVINAEIGAKASQAFTHKEAACSAPSALLSKEAAEQAESMSDAAKALLANHPLLSSYDQPGQAPTKIDLSGREGELASLERQAQTHKLVVDKSLDRRGAAVRSEGIARGSLDYMVKICSAKGSSRANAFDVADQMEEKIDAIENLLPDLDYQHMFMDGLSSKLEAARWYLSALKGQNTSHRECLNTTPDLQAIMAEFNAVLEQGNNGVDDAKGHATVAFSCYNAWEEAGDCKLKSDCDEGYSCEDGQCVVPQHTSCDSDANCPAGYVCSDASLCTPQGGELGGESEEDPIFSVADAEEVDDEEAAFSVAGAEELKDEASLFSVAGEEAASNVDITSTHSTDCSHIPGSTAVQGSCICIDGLLLSPSRGRCVSCDEYHQAANSAVAEGNYSAAQAIVSEARECSSWAS